MSQYSNDYSMAKDHNDNYWERKFRIESKMQMRRDNALKQLNIPMGRRVKVVNTLTQD